MTKTNNQTKGSVINNNQSLPVGGYMPSKHRVTTHKPYTPPKPERETVSPVPYQELSKRYRRLVNICQQPIKYFTNMKADSPDVVQVVDTQHGPLIHYDRGGTMLAVGHLDTVLDHAPIIGRETGNIYCGQLDDRLGVWGILYGLRQYIADGVVYDILLTDSEESGQSTAQYFAEHFPDRCKEYNWIFELDRMNTDCALYQYSNGTLDQQLVADGWTTVRGSFTDIAYMSDCKTQAVNFGIGYSGQHTDRCKANLETVETQLQRIAAFINANANTKYTYEPPTYTRHRRSQQVSHNPYAYGGLDHYSDHDDYLGYNAVQPKKKLSLPPTQFSEIDDTDLIGLSESEMDELIAADAANAVDTAICTCHEYEELRRDLDCVDPTFTYDWVFCPFCGCLVDADPEDFIH